MSKDKKYMTLDEWYGEFARQASIEVLRLIDDEKKALGDAAGFPLTQNFLASFIGAVIYDTVLHAPDENAPRKEQYEAALKSFQEVKTLVQDAVAAGVQGAMKKYSGQQVEYYCLIKPVPNAVNKEPC